MLMLVSNCTIVDGGNTIAYFRRHLRCRHYLQRQLRLNYQSMFDRDSIPDFMIRNRKKDDHKLLKAIHLDLGLVITSTCTAGGIFLCSPKSTGF